MFRPISLAAFLLCTAVPLWAQDRAVIVGNENYSDGADITEADAALGAVDALQAAGFDVTSGQDMQAPEIRGLLSPLVQAAPENGRLVIVLSGHFAQAASNTWFLGVEASVPDLATVDGVGISLATVLEVASEAPGGAVVVLGTEPRRLPLGPGLDPGIGSVPVPQGVTLIRGDAARVADFVARALPLRGQSLAVMLDANPDLTADGFLSGLVPFRPADAGAAADPLPGPDAEAVFWESTVEQGTLGAYEAYAKRYAKGRYLDEARAEIARIKAEPQREAREAEAALALNRDDRRAIQRGLSLVGYDPKGIDGVFGAGSRTAIAAWQKKNGYEATSYLTRDQIVKLTEQADARSAALEAEAAARQKAVEAEDRAYWQETGAAGDEAGLRTYLKRYPDGLYADLAEERLKASEADRMDQAEAADRAAWDLASRDQTIASYQDYLASYPDGAFAGEAQARIDALTSEAESGDQTARQEAVEAALGLGPEARRVIETRLDALGLKPGKVDGQFDDRTRRAIRRFQEARNMDATGYLDQTTTVALLAGAVLRLGN
ncbi:peptidoglycan-binding protein [Paragemmobacter straminiformis]|uniref:Peptidoglycan-binding protein n=1 Tax=Paragemmobacter straminiformis TaxID=2045119 RepID=A0A842I5I3_9RHOB|nr:peptidoglycan-binding protein [Gemmobacter straminiformis]MBC2834919.1 peptidoglycan-binding protein [Gemmobacter straminiformis]